jgi:hypothetical protein
MILNAFWKHNLENQIVYCQYKSFWVSYLNKVILSFPYVLGNNQF